MEKLTFGNHNKAQSLMEAIVAISIVATGVVAILAVGLAHLSLGGQSAERIMATNLAREGIEVIMAIRNSNWLDPAESWPYGMDNGSYIVNFSSYDPLTAATPPDVSVPANCTNCYLRQQADDTYIHYESEEVFRRLVVIVNGDDLGSNCSNDCEKKIISSVYWQERGRPHTVTLETRVTAWR